MNKNYLLFLLIALLAGCKGPAPAPAPKVRDFPMVPVPALISDPGERMEYAATHYWDAFADTSAVYLCDTAHIGGVDKDIVEKQVGTFATLLGGLGAAPAGRATAAVFDRRAACARKDTSSNIFDGVCALLTRYLYDPNSPVRNEDAYLPFVKKMSESDLVPESMRPAYAFDAKACGLNRTGTRAADFGFTDLQGKRHTLYAVTAPLTVLLFSNPGCPNCREIMQALTGDALLRQAVEAGVVAVVNVYIDLEREKWAAYAKDYPKEWYNGYDHTYRIRTDMTYNIRAIPSLYLLGADKTVILKDATIEKLMNTLYAMLQQAK